MATNSFSGYFIPELWSKEVLRIFNVNCVMRNIVNTDYEGEIKNYGDTVKIRYFGDVSIVNYTRETDMSFSSLTDNLATLTIDKQKAFIFEVDDLDVAQADIDIISGYTNRAGIGMATAIDSLLLGEYVNAHASVGTDTAPIDLASTSVDIYNKIIDINVVMDEHNIPSVDRFLVVPPRVAGVIRKNSLFVQANTSGDGGSLLRTGQIGNIAGMNIVVSNNITAVDPPTSALATDIYPCLALTRDAITFAMQLTKVEAVRPTMRFTTIIKGLALFGYRTVQPTAMVAFKVNAATI